MLADVGMRLEMPATAVLTCLAERGSQRLSTVADVLDLDLSSVSRQVTALERLAKDNRKRDKQQVELLLHTEEQARKDAARAAYYAAKGQVEVQAMSEA